MKFTGKPIMALAIGMGMALSSVAVGAPNADKILANAEKVRNPDQDYVVRVKVLETKSGKKQAPKEFETMIKGRDKALIKFKKPASEVGKSVLMVGSDMWISMPTTSKPIRVSPKQKMAGNAAYGDIARLNFVGNYKATYKKSATYKGQRAHVLSLEAIPGKPVTYQKVEYWVNAKNNRPLVTYYQSRSGKTMKTGYFEKYEEVFGVTRPTRFKLKDNIVKNSETTVEFMNAKQVSLPDILFEKQNLGRG